MNDNQPIFLQIMERIESDIITGVYQTDDLIVSTTQLSKLYSVNPATAVKAVGKLMDEGVLRKDRGIGMRVAPRARQKISRRRRQAFLRQGIDAFLAEAETLGLSLDQLVEELRRRAETRATAVPGSLGDGRAGAMTDHQPPQHESEDR
ncbi:MAG: GntR family transcriptional regulator [Propionibacteriaceae bacterium]|nr:GntR family transcriptional regulator [Propionibacteriaceae bacterium]